ncbi:protein kinase PINOID-like [Andrographis paniculata]|uniref:protein kinase PINOID-like n=1 Tax=Andrographis paniculata TaxID=175694 RepID=UPI0021E7AB9D|nr:protein kinase PINOID-like [Andrographis paniculata]
MSELRSSSMEKMQADETLIWNSEELISEGFSSMSSDTTVSHCTSFSRLSFELPTGSPEQPPPPSMKPHRSSDSSFQPILLKSNLSFRDFSLVRQIGSGDIGRVYLCRLRGSPEDGRFYAMKVVDNQVLSLKKKTQRAETERKIMRLLDHPFLPTLYAEFEASNFSGVVMEYCSGGDLHSLRHKQPQKRFSVASARFYAAEVLVALEYLHMLGIIYRDLKPENVLVRSDGHIMLTDFDLSLCSDAIPSVESPAGVPPPSSRAGHSAATVATFPGLLNRFFRSKKKKRIRAAENRVFVAEPVAARSCSFVGTHEYVAPEVASGGPHGNAVDWWALGIFIYEMIYGRTPFAGSTNEATLRNIVENPVTFPPDAPCGASEAHARSLIAGLLNKDPSRRVGSRRGSADVKTHPFFKGLNFALIRSVTPPSGAGIRAPLPDRTAPFNVY